MAYALRRSNLWIAASLLAAALVASPGARSQATTTSESARARARAPLTVRLIGLRSDKGQVGCLLFNNARGYPQEGKIAYQGLWCPVAKRESICKFGPIPPGVYALGCFHDEDNDRELDTGFLGVPVEGVVASNHATGFMGPPSYKDARFKFSGKPTEIRLRMDY